MDVSSIPTVTSAGTTLLMEIIFFCILPIMATLVNPLGQDFISGSVPLIHRGRRASVMNLHPAVNVTIDPHGGTLFGHSLHYTRRGRGEPKAHRAPVAAQDFVNN